ncbi:glycosyltransferase [Collinsella intestinalis]|uniref:glycosyltransferase n=1 Tax=Collinsella intestinalis TaxID=147207 RepID=UPI003F50496E
MSSYNGAKYISQQIDSVLSQDLAGTADLSLYVRDDGSTDGTCQILQSYEDVQMLELIKGENIGVCKSFISLLQAIPQDYDYVALCDQDDVWHANKLFRAISVLSSTDQNIAQLYCSEFIFCDADLNIVRKSQLNKCGVCFEKLLFENICSGNTMVMNRTLHRIVASSDSEGVYCHDWWIALLAASFGDVYFDKNFYSLDYRRIGSNASPAGSDMIKLFIYRLNKFIRGGDLKRIESQLQKLQCEMGERLDPEKALTLNMFLRKGRLQKAFANIRLRQTLSSELMLRILFLSGLL